MALGGPAPDAPKATIVLDHAAQQFSPSFRRASCSDSIRVEVLYGADNRSGHHDINFARDIQWDVDLHSGYSWRVPGGEGVVWARNAWKILSEMNPSVIVCFGWRTHVARLAFLWAVVNSTPVLLYGDSTWQSSDRPHMRRLRPLILRCLFRLASGAVSTGTFNREFYILHGMHPQVIYPGVCPVDVESFRAARGASAIEDCPVIGFAGKFIPRKGAAELIDALALLSDERWQAHLIGDGLLRDQLVHQVAHHGLTERVQFAGFVNTAAMPAALAKCDILVVPSTRDLRVLVAAEAMAAGCVVVVSSNTAVWGPGDLIEDRVTGRVYRSGEPAELAAVLKELLNDPEMRQRLRCSSMERAEQFGPESFTTTLEQAIAGALSF